MVECNLCGWSGEQFDPRFREGGRRVVCPSCLSLDRNRHLWCLLQEFSPLDASAALLDIAPSPALTARIEPRCRYVSIDVQAATPAVIPMNVTRIEFPSDYFSVVLCSDVLEHVRDDDAALREIHRVLRPGGVLFLRVPYSDELPATDEWSVPDEHGHWRNYSPTDIADRLGALGFHTTPRQSSSGASLVAPRPPRHVRGQEGRRTTDARLGLCATRLGGRTASGGHARTAQFQPEADQHVRMHREPTRVRCRSVRARPAWEGLDR